MDEDQLQGTSTPLHMSTASADPSLYHSTVSQLDSSTVVERNETASDQLHSLLESEKNRKNNEVTSADGLSGENEAKNSSDEHHVELHSNISPEQAHEFKEKLENMEGDILQVR
jgi:ribosomal protein L7/L12